MASFFIVKIKLFLGHSLNITKSANKFIHKVLRISWLFCIFRYSPENKI